MPGPARVAPDRELLLASHQFPGEYIVKAFGPGTDRFRTDVKECAAAVVGLARVRVDERMSSRGRRTCVTLTLAADSVDEVIGVYELLHRIPDLMLIL